MQTHENFSEFRNVEKSSDRNFGLVMAVVFSLIALYPLLEKTIPHWWALAVSLGFLALSLGYPRALNAPKLLWLKFGELLHRITSPLILGFMFYGIITPTAIVIRIAGRDLIGKKLDPEANSYWVMRDPPGPEPKQMENQF